MSGAPCIDCFHDQSDHFAGPDPDGSCDACNCSGYVSMDEDEA